LWGLSGPSTQGLMSRHVGGSDQGKLQGALGSLQGVAGMIGPLLFTQVFAFALRSDGALHLPGAPYLVAAVLVALALYVAMRATRPGTVDARTEQSNA